MRKRIALVLIKLAHKVYPPKVVETLGDDGQPVTLAFDRLAAGLAGARPVPGAARAAELGVELANRSIQRIAKMHGDAGRDSGTAYGKGLGPLTELRYDE
ncbi:hypothetical protein I5J49_gp75 [Mycobacterium phage ThulaThula]|uniref:Uncharacterized protein n=1 Tax=Mycobacterium phage ThulaThula TaxID=2599880 RepID=A0A5J6TE35_9CAUD|nr:hypothetical protein I5J49_gp75 [Mycobacterium phage ThulaThula]QFG09101.1 hypothetical protein PBI_THULATHULA_75 [Mycobacterium phage ThulaThula]